MALSIKVEKPGPFHMAAFSSYVAHMITTVEGGMVVMNRLDFAEVLRSLRAHGRACKCEICVLNAASGYCNKRFQYGDNKDIRFIFERIGFSSKMNELEAAIGLGNITMYSQILNKRRGNLYEEVGPHAFAIILGENVKFSRDDLTCFLEKHEIETRNLFSSMPTQCAGFGCLGYKEGEFPNAEYIGDNGLHIGIHQDLDKKCLDYVLSVIEDFLSKSK